MNAAVWRKAGRGQRGSATVWVVAVCGLVLLLGGVVTLRTGAVLARHRAEIAADLAALAGAERIGLGGSPCVAAARIARLNAGQVGRCTVSLDPGGRSGTVDVVVTVSVRLSVVGLSTVPATARAGRLPG